jgi:hypothetical protein
VWLKNWQKPRLAFPEKLALTEKPFVKIPLPIVISQDALRRPVSPLEKTPVVLFGYSDVANASCAKLINAANIGGKEATHNRLLEKIRGAGMTRVAAIRKIDRFVLCDGGSWRNVLLNEG